MAEVAAVLQSTGGPKGSLSNDEKNAVAQNLLVLRSPSATVDKKWEALRSTYDTLLKYSDAKFDDLAAAEAQLLMESKCTNFKPIDPKEDWLLQANPALAQEIYQRFVAPILMTSIAPSRRVTYFLGPAGIGKDETMRNAANYINKKLKEVQTTAAVLGEDNLKLARVMYSEADLNPLTFETQKTAGDMLQRLLECAQQAISAHYPVTGDAKKTIVPTQSILYLRNFDQLMSPTYIGGRRGGCNCGEKGVGNEDDDEEEDKSLFGIGTLGSRMGGSSDFNDEKIENEDAKKGGAWPQHMQTLVNTVLREDYLMDKYPNVRVVLDVQNPWQLGQEFSSISAAQGVMLMPWPSANVRKHFFLRALSKALADVKVSGITAMVIKPDGVEYKFNGIQTADDEKFTAAMDEFVTATGPSMKHSFGVRRIFQRSSVQQYIVEKEMSQQDVVETYRGVYQHAMTFDDMAQFFTQVMQETQRLVSKGTRQTQTADGKTKWLAESLIDVDPAIDETTKLSKGRNPLCRDDMIPILATEPYGTAVSIPPLSVLMKGARSLAASWYSGFKEVVFGSDPEEPESVAAVKAAEQSPFTANTCRLAKGCWDISMLEIMKEFPQWVSVLKLKSTNLENVKKIKTNEFFGAPENAPSSSRITNAQLFKTGAELQRLTAEVNTLTKIIDKVVEYGLKLNVFTQSKPDVVVTNDFNTTEIVVNGATTTKAKILVSTINTMLLSKQNTSPVPVCQVASAADMLNSPWVPSVQAIKSVKKQWQLMQRPSSLSDTEYELHMLHRLNLEEVRAEEIKVLQESAKQIEGQISSS